MTDKHEHYKKDVSHLKLIDVYRIIDLYRVTDGCFQHALKKILVPGQRGHKDLRKDIEDIIDSMQRKLEMMEEDKLVCGPDFEDGPEFEGWEERVREPTLEERIREASDDLWRGPYPTKPTTKTLGDVTPEEWDAVFRKITTPKDRDKCRKHIARRSPSLRYPYHVQSQETVKDPLPSGREECL